MGWTVYRSAIPQSGYDISGLLGAISGGYVSQTQGEYYEK